MARKVFISFLGTNNYVETIYEYPDGTLSKPVRFIQEALILDLCTNWTSKDKIYIFCTDGAYKSNWEDNGQTKADSEIEKIGLEHRLKENYPLFNIVERIRIDEGFSENEVWNIFNTVYDKLEREDEIYFDVTHAFRSIPMFSTVLFNFSQFMKDTKVVSVHYGAFEKLGFASTVKKEIPLERRIAPIIDLTSMVQLQQLTQVSNDIITYGKVKGIGNAFNSSINDKNFQMLVSGLRNNVAKVDEYILTNKVEKLREGSFVSEIKGRIKKIKGNGQINYAQELLIDQLEQALSNFSPNGGDSNIIAAINWALDYDMILQAYTLAEELLIEKVVALLGSKLIFNNELDNRNFVSCIMSISLKKIEEENPFDDNNLDPAYIENMLSNEIIAEMRKNYPTLSANRNILCHAKKATLTIDQFKSQLTSSFDACWKVIGKFNNQ